MSSIEQYHLRGVTRVVFGIGGAPFAIWISVDDEIETLSMKTAVVKIYVERSSNFVWFFLLKMQRLPNTQLA